MVSEDSTPTIIAQESQEDTSTSRSGWFQRLNIKVEGTSPDLWYPWRAKRQRRKEPNTSPEGYLTRREAATYLGVSVRFLEGNTSIPKIDVAGPGSKRATWRYRRADLDGWAAQRKSAQTVGSAD